MAATALTIARQLLAEDDDARLIERTSGSLNAPGWDNLISKHDWHDANGNRILFGDPYIRLYDGVREKDAAKIRQALEDLDREVGPVFEKYGITSHDQFQDAFLGYIAYGIPWEKRRREKFWAGHADISLGEYPDHLKRDSYAVAV